MWFPGTLIWIQQSEEESLSCVQIVFLEIKHVGLGFATASSSPVFLSCILSDMVFAFSIERKWLQENKEKFMMLNKRRRWVHHSSRVKLSFGQHVSQVGSWCQHIWSRFWGPKLILSNNQSSATLWVLDTCLIIGLRPLMIILITDPLSSRMYSWTLPWE